jgi:hypothetical protein
MNPYRPIVIRFVLLLSLMANLTVLSSRIQADSGSCGGGTLTLPFTDVMASPFFCQIAAAYFSGLTNGTSATTYSPAANVTREQMAAFTTRTMDQSLKRGSRRAVTKKWWTPLALNGLVFMDVGIAPLSVEFDGTDLWVANLTSATVMRIRPSDGKLLDTWTGATGAYGIVCAMGKIFVTGATDPGRLYMIDPSQPARVVTTLTSSLGPYPISIAFDGVEFYTVNEGSISYVGFHPITVVTVTTGFVAPVGILYDGANIWVTDIGDDTLKKLSPGAQILQTIAVGNNPFFPVFDGTNIWVPNAGSNSMTVVRAKDAVGNPLSTAFVLTTLIGNGMFYPLAVAFDGERILVTNLDGDTVSLWKAADLTPLGWFPTGDDTNPYGVCSDGLNFWVTLSLTNKLMRF